MGEVRKFIFSNESITWRDSLQSLFVTTRDGNIARRAHEFFVTVPQLRTVGVFNARQIPIDLQTIARLFRRPEAISHNRYAAALRERNFKHFTNSINRTRIFVIKALDSPAEHGRMRDNRDLHSGKIEVKSKLLRSVTLWSAIKTPNLLADEPKLRRIFETSFVRHGFAGRVLRQLSVTSRPVPGTIDDTVLSAALIWRDVPAISGRGD